MKPLRVAVLGNCQARPMTGALQRDEGVEVVYTGIVHLLTDADRPELDARLATADVIVTQSIADSYPRALVHTSRLLDEYGDKVVRVANLYFRGYNPELVYVRRPGTGTLRGPLGDYHSDTVLGTWGEGGTAIDAAERMANREWNAARYAAVADASLRELSDRDAVLDVPAAAMVADRWRDERLFFTFNHPTNALLGDYCGALHRKLGTRAVPAPADIGEPLGQFAVGANAASGIRFDDEFVDGCRGVEVAIADDGKVSTGARCAYDPVELAEAFFRVYDGNAPWLTAHLGRRRAAA